MTQDDYEAQIFDAWPRKEPNEPISPELRKTLAKEAKELIESRIFQEAIHRLEAQWYWVLMTDTPDRDKRDELVAQLKALRAISKALESIINDQKAAIHRMSHVGRV